MNELVILYLVDNNEVHALEVDETELSNIRDYVNNLIEGGFNDFRLYENCCNFGAFRKITEVKNGKIIKLNDVLCDSEQLGDQRRLQED